MFGHKQNYSPRLIGLISLPGRNSSFATRIYEQCQFNDRSFTAETSIGEEPDGRIVSHADQLGELMRVHLDRIYETQLAHAILL